MNVSPAPDSLLWSDDFLPISTPYSRPCSSSLARLYLNARFEGHKDLFFLRFLIFKAIIYGLP